MKINKVMKILTSVLIATMLLISFSQVILAVDTTIDLDQFDGVTDTSGASTSVTTIIGSLIYIARVIGAGVAIIMLIVLAIRYITSSPEGKGEIKKSAPAYIAGAIILFAASALLGIIQNFAGNVQSA